MDTVWRRVYDTYLRDSGQVHYQLSYIFFKPEIVAIRGRATADVSRFLTVYLRGYNSNKMNKFYQNNGFVKQQTAGY
jgi:hypothetical protein